MTEEQNAVDDQQQAGTEGADSGKSELDSYLEEYDKKKPDRKPKSDFKELAPVVEFAKTEMERKRGEVLQKDIDSAVDFMKEPDETKEFPKRLIRGFLEAYAGENKPFEEAFINRQKNPAAWQEALATARGEFLKEIKELPTNQVRSDIEAAKAAVQGSSTEEVSTEGPSLAEKLSMSDEKWTNYLQEKIAETQ